MASSVERSDELDDASGGAVAREVNRDGRALAMTVFSPIRPWHRRAPPPAEWYHRGVLWLWALFTVARALPERSKRIRDLSFIHFARWIVIRRLPDHGQPGDRLKQPLLMFESNYNGSFDQYIDGFANILTNGMVAIWGTSYGFPGPRPVAPFKTYIHANEFIANHYYSAYPDATTTMINSALTAEESLERFTQRASTIAPETFAADYRALVTALTERRVPRSAAIGSTRFTGRSAAPSPRHGSQRRTSRARSSMRVG